MTDWLATFAQRPDWLDLGVARRHLSLYAHVAIEIVRETTSATCCHVHRACLSFLASRTILTRYVTMSSHPDEANGLDQIASSLIPNDMANEDEVLSATFGPFPDYAIPTPDSLGLFPLNLSTTLPPATFSYQEYVLPSPLTVLSPMNLSSEARDQERIDTPTLEKKSGEKTGVEKLIQHVSARVQDLQRSSNQQVLRVNGRITKQKKALPGLNIEKARRCLRCTLQHNKCVGLTRAICTSCAQATIPASLCSRDSLLDNPIFQKWDNGQYRLKLQWSAIDWCGNQALTTVYHHEKGPRLVVQGSRFNPTHPEQNKLWGKTKTGWVARQTQSWGLHEPPTAQEIQKYVSDCMPHSWSHDDQPGLLMPMTHTDLELWDDAVKLWTANCLLLKGWQSENVPRVVDGSDPYFGMKPASRVMQNCLDLQLESYVSRLEQTLLKKINKALRHRKEVASWNELFAATFILLSVMEKDIWRLVYWVRHKEEAYQWRHPSTARQLIDRAVFQANILLVHLRLSGDVPSAFRMPSLHAINASDTTAYLEDDDNSLRGTLTRALLDTDTEDEKFRQIPATHFS